MVAGGVALSLAFPNELVPGRLGDRPPAVIAWLALLPLWWAVLQLPVRQARWAVWLYGLSCYLGTLTWMCLFGEGLFAIVPWVLLAGYLSLTPLLTLVITRWMPLPRWLVPLGFALAWTGLEWLRGQGLFGFAWSELGASQVDGISARLAALGGVPLITFFLLWTSGTVMQVLLERTAPLRVLPVIGVLGVALLGGWRQSALARARWEAQADLLTVSVIQPNSPRGLTPAVLVHGSSEEELRARLDTLLSLSYRANNAPHPAGIPRRPHLFVWPESALREPPTYHPDIGQMCGTTESWLLLGAPYLDAQSQLRNSAFLLGPRGQEQSRYDKIHLVPFGEFVPMRALVQRFYDVRADDIIPGDQRRLLQIRQHTIGVGICFESVFTAISREYARQGAHLLVFITNDAWFHQTSAVRQHFNQARFRALETGLPVARCASTGISGFIAPDGEILEEIATYTTGARTLDMPRGIPGTVYTHGGWMFGPGCLLLTLVLALIGLEHICRQLRADDGSLTP